MSDATETIRRELVAEPGSREYLEAKHGKVWSTSELQEEFEVLGFMAPLIAVEQRSTGQKGLLYFQHSPRFYFDFEAK
jgi:hypothetical protein